jgi:hypothetical protein
MANSILNSKIHVILHVTSKTRSDLLAHQQLTGSGRELFRRVAQKKSAYCYEAGPV